MSLALPGSKELYSALQICFKSDKKHICLTTMVHNFLDNFWRITRTLHNCPTRVYVVVPTSPAMVGSTDGSGLGMSGTYFIPTPWLTPERPDYYPYLWRQPYKQWIPDALLTFTNPQGTITNSDLELMETVAHHDVIATHHGVTELTLRTAHNNYAPIIWNRKRSTSTTGPAAYPLQLQSLLTWHHCYAPLHNFIPGHLNHLADEASRRFEWSDNQLLTHFNMHYPQPRPWQLSHL